MTKKSWVNIMARNQIVKCLILSVFVFLSSFCSCWVKAEFNSAGVGIQSIISGTVPNGEFYWETRYTWTNLSAPPKPYVVKARFQLPPCDNIETARLYMTVWGGTASYTCKMNLKINETNIPQCAPFIFGGTNDTNTIFSPISPNVYGAGYGVWLLGIPVPSNLLLKDGSWNTVTITIETTDSFDGRIQYVTLAAVYKSQSLNNQLEYVFAEGSGDIYRQPTGAQTDNRIFSMFINDTNQVTSARLNVLYTYGDTGQNDRIFFNGSQLGSNDVAVWDKSATGLDYGPSVATFDVSNLLSKENTVKVSVSSLDVPDPRETSLRPQVAVLTVNRTLPLPTLNIGLKTVISWNITTDKYQLEYSTNLNSNLWLPVTNSPMVIDGQNIITISPTYPEKFFRLRKIE